MERLFPRVLSIAAFASILLAMCQVSLAERSDARATIDEAIEAAGGREVLARYQRPFYYERKGSCEVAREGIRHQFPRADEMEVERRLRQRLEAGRR